MGLLRTALTEINVLRVMEIVPHQMTSMSTSRPARKSFTFAAGLGCTRVNIAAVTPLAAIRGMPAPSRSRFGQRDQSGHFG